MVYIIGTDDPETITGTEQSDTLQGRGGDDHLIGLGGWDYLYGDGGADLLEGGLGDDIYQLYADTTDTIIDIGGWDMIRTDIGRDLNDYPEIEALTGLISYNGRPLRGNALDNLLVDADGSNLLDGRDGNDVLRAGGGDDFLIGGNGIDGLYGQAGADRFDFRSVEEIGVGEGTRDVIWDFAAQVDKINLGLIDANEKHTGNQGFTYLGDADFTGTDGELRWEWTKLANGLDVTLVEGDTNGDGVADFEIQLKGQVTLSASDFIL
jgi:serralysin